MVKKVMLVMIAAAFFSCENGMYEIMSRDTDDPPIETPRVLSFRVSNATVISWSDDSRADEYILQKAYDSISPFWTTIYRGKNISYQDTGLADNGQYLYRLAKTRGRKVFTPSVPVLGIGHVVCRDDYEPNDTIEQAVRLYDIDIDANFYFYRSYLGDEVFDEDWYYVDIPAMRKATIEINDKKVQTGSTESHFRIYHLNGMDSDVKQLEPFAIENNELVGRRKYFKIFADKKMFTPGTPTVDVGGDIVDYTVRLTGIVTLDSQ